MGPRTLTTCNRMRPVANWSRLPEALRERPQWAVAGASKAPMAMGPKGKLFNVSVTSPGQWMSFTDAVALAEANAETVTTWVNPQGVTITQTGFTVGYILNSSDPFSCID